VLLGPEKLLHWIQTLGGTGGSAPTVALSGNANPTSPAAPSIAATATDIWRPFIEVRIAILTGYIIDSKKPSRSATPATDTRCTSV
jgi:hypothetical protein